LLGDSLIKRRRPRGHHGTPHVGAEISSAQR
jgi:hypothetical protein